jgi:hypothetical protein
MEKINLQAKDQLARMLATENIYVRHQAIKSAAFDLVSRRLYLPIWKDMSDSLYTMLIGHEVGHALYDEHKNIQVLGAQIDSEHPRIAAGYWNVVADVRIERFMKKKFPGWCIICAEGYDELLKRNFFGPKLEPSNMCLIDRINLHFKVGNQIKVSFTPDEQVFVEKVNQTISQADVVTVAKEIYEWAKEHGEHSQSQSMQDMLDEVMKEFQEAFSDANENNEDSESENDESDGSNTIEGEVIDSDDNEPKKEKLKKSKEDKNDSKNDKSESDDSSDDSDDSNNNEEGDKSESDGSDSLGDNADKADESDGSNTIEIKVIDSDDNEPKKEKPKKPKENKKDSKNDKSESDADANDSAIAAGDGDIGDDNKPAKSPPAAASTEENFIHNLESLVDDNAKPIVYINFPEPNLKEILVDYQKVHRNMKNFFDAEDVKTATQKFKAFCEEHKPKIDYLHQQFELKKQADQYQKTKQHQTGTIDTLRLPCYRTHDDIFKTNAIVPHGKNHALLFIIDWSGSMDDKITGTIQQAILKALFCRRASIPFEMYSFTISHGRAFDQKLGDLGFSSNLKMRCYLSSEMTAQEFYDACVHLFCLISTERISCVPEEDSLVGSTPLNEAIVAAMSLTENLRKKTGAQIINVVFLTDGDANTVNCYMDEHGRICDIHGGIKFLLEDKITHKVYNFNAMELTSTLLRILRDRQNVHVVGFFIGADRQAVGKFFPSLKREPENFEKLGKEFENSGILISTEYGYDELYIIKNKNSLRVKTPAPTFEQLQPHIPGEDGYLYDVAKSITKQHNNETNQRIILNRFITMIA